MSLVFQFITLVIPGNNSPETICFQSFCHQSGKISGLWHGVSCRVNQGGLRHQDEGQRSELGWKQLWSLPSMRSCPEIPGTPFLSWHLVFLDADTFQNFAVKWSHLRHSSLWYHCVAHSKHLQNGLKIGLSVTTVKKIEKFQQSDTAE